MEQLIAAAERKRNYHTLDGLRGVAAIAVVMGHYSAMTKPFEPGSTHLAVDLFFMMSGFVLAHAYDGRLRAGMTPAAFMVARLCRLYPMYVLGSAISAVGIALALARGLPMAWTWRTLAAGLALGALFLPAPIPGKKGFYPLNAPAWSLCSELLANALFAVAHPYLGERRLAVVMLAGAALVVVDGVATGSLNGGFDWSNAISGFVRVAYAFPMGVLLYRLAARGFGAAPRVPALMLLAATGLVLVPHVPEGVRPIYDLACVFLLFPAILWLAVHNEPTRGQGAFTFLGLVSYPLYVTNIPVESFVTGATKAVLHDEVQVHAPWIGMAVLTMLVLMSWALARYVERPATRRMAKVLKSRSREDPVSRIAVN